MSTNGDTNRIALVRALIDQTSKDELGLPRGIYRADLLPEPTVLTLSPPLASLASLASPQSPSQSLSPSSASTLPPQTTDEHSHTESESDPDSESKTLVQCELFEGVALSPDKALTTQVRHSRNSQKGNGGNELSQHQRLSQGQSHNPNGSSSGYTVVVADKYAVDSRYLTAAYQELNHDEGFPALPDGSPFWEQFDFEPTTEYELFRVYLQQEGARQVSLIPTPSEWADRPTALRETAILYYWQHRARAFDLFKEADLRRKRAQRVLTMEDDHFRKATQLLEVCEAYMVGDEFADLINPKTAIDGLRAGAQLQRVALGLPAQGPPNKGDDGTPDGSHVPVEVIMRTRAKNHIHTEVEAEAEDDTALSQLLQDPEALEQAQELIIRVNTKA